MFEAESNEPGVMQILKDKDWVQAFRELCFKAVKELTGQFCIEDKHASMAEDGSSREVACGNTSTELGNSETTKDNAEQILCFPSKDSST